MGADAGTADAAGDGVTGELRALTAARGIAAWWVVLYHIRLSVAGLPVAVRDVLAKGYLAVDFFFLLSGFVIWLSWSERLRSGGWQAVPGFLWRRIARVWPLHLVILGGAIVLAGVLAASGRHDAAEFPWDELPLHLTLVQNWGFTRALSWNDPAWSISCEMGAYLVFPVLAWAIEWRRVPTAAVLATLMALGVLLAAVFARAGAVTLGMDIARLGLVRCLLEFAAGGALASLWWRWRGLAGRATACAVGAASMALGWAAGLPEALAVPATFAALLLALALTAGRPRHALEGRALHALGEWSYATYLGHFMLWFAFKLAFVADPYAVPPVLVAAYLALALVTSVALYRWVERPAQAWLNGWRWPVRAVPLKG